MAEFGDVDRALVQLTDVVAREPDNWLAWNITGLLHARTNNHVRAVDTFRRSLRHQYFKPEIYLDLARSLFSLGDATLSFENYLTAIALEPGNADLEKEARMVGLKSGHAIDQFQNELKSDELRNHEQDINNKIQAGDTYQALHSAAKIIEMGLESPFIRYNMALAQQSFNKVDETIEHLTVVCAQMPAFSAAHLGLGDYLRKSSRLHQAEDWFHIAISGKPADVSNSRVLLLARAAYENAVRHDPTLVANFTALGNVCCDVGNNDDAVAAYRAAIQLEPNNAVICYNLARVLMTLGQYAEAVEPALKSVAIDPEFYEGQTCLANIYSELNQAAEAAHHFSLALNCRAAHASAAYI